MKILKFLVDLNIISSLGDNPCTDNGLTPEGLKAKFDEAGLRLQNYINTEIVDKINALFSVDAPLYNGANMSGPINMNGQPISGLNSPTANDQAANMGFVNQQVKKAAPRNLLDNSDFTNPVNQRGATSIDLSTNLYIIDRWFVTNTGGLVSVDSSGITLAPTADKYVDIIQKIEGIDALIGRKFTLAVCVNNTWECAVFTMCDLNGGKRLNCGVTIFSINNWHVVLRLYHDYAESVTIQKAALYEGEYTAETLPEYQPKGYGAELAECQRYYYQSWDSSHWDGKTVKENPITGFVVREAFVSSRLYGIELPATMRVIPTIEFYSTRGVADAVSEYSNGSIYISRIDPVYHNNKTFIPAAANNDLVAGKQYAFHYSANADL